MDWGWHNPSALYVLFISWALKKGQSIEVGCVHCSREFGSVFLRYAGAGIYLGGQVGVGVAQVGEVPDGDGAVGATRGQQVGAVQ